MSLPPHPEEQNLETALLLYSYWIPISLYVSIEKVKVLRSIFINQDLQMYYEEADKPVCARTSNSNEELGQVDIILFDKTRTLTSNSMELGPNVIQNLTICHTTLLEVDEETGRISYEAESPDDAAFVIAAREPPLDLSLSLSLSVSQLLAWDGVSNFFLLGWLGGTPTTKKLAMGEFFLAAFTKNVAIDTL